ncbi:PepSY domain-containing protein [Propionibacteriaceae bacterium Y2011]|uniref:PepSY domain-containing protein n=1 Tax=Microlunatus sp. Y2014 TaxID=3418488 RepID=UPI003B4CF740
MDRTKHLRLAGAGLLAAALLTGCAGNEPAAPNTENPPASSSAPAEPSSSAPPASSGAPSPGASSSSAAASSDPVFAAIQAVLAQHSGAIIVEIDRDDDDTMFEVEAVVGNEIRDFDVTADGQVREDDDDDDDDDDIRKAKEATITAEQAARAALEGRTGSTIDSISLEDDDGTLRWEVELDNEQGEDDVELYVDAKTGEVTEGDN